MTQNQLKFLELEEAKRHNAATEEDTDVANAEKERDNRARLAETNRSNLVNEKLTKRKDTNTTVQGYFNSVANIGKAIGSVVGALTD